MAAVPCAEIGHNHRPIHISVGVLSPQQFSPSAARALARRRIAQTLAWTWIARALARPRIARTLAWTWIARALARPRIARTLAWTWIARTRCIGRAGWAEHRRRGCFDACLARPGHSAPLGFVPALGRATPRECRGCQSRQRGSRGPRRGDVHLT